LPWGSVDFVMIYSIQVLFDNLKSDFNNRKSEKPNRGVSFTLLYVCVCVFVCVCWIKKVCVNVCVYIIYVTRGTNFCGLTALWGDKFCCKIFPSFSCCFIKHWLYSENNSLTRKFFLVCPIWLPVFSFFSIIKWTRSGYFDRTTFRSWIFRLFKCNEVTCS